MTTTTTTIITIRANADLDDCLQGAEAAYIADHPTLAGWDLCPRWADDNDREWVLLTVPVWAMTTTTQDEEAGR